MTDSVLIVFILLMYFFLYYSTFMIDVRYFSDSIVIFFTILTAASFPT